MAMHPNLPDGTQTFAVFKKVNQSMKPIAPLTHQSPRSPSRRLGMICLVLFMACGLTACEAGRFLAYAIGGDGEKKVKVKAQYTDLQGKTFAVLVAADDYTTFTYPGAPLSIARSVTSNIAANVPDAQPMDPKAISRFQKENPYWITVPYSQLFDRLKVDRIIIIDLVEFALREPGNSHIWQGQLVANVGLAEAETSEGNRLALSTIVKSRFPDDTSKVGILNSDDATIQLGLISDFSMRTANLFRDHEDVIK